MIYVIVILFNIKLLEVQTGCLVNGCFSAELSVAHSLAVPEPSVIAHDPHQQMELFHISTWALMFEVKILWIHSDIRPRNIARQEV